MALLSGLIQNRGRGLRPASMPKLPVAVAQENNVVSLPSTAKVNSSVNSSVTTRSG